MTTRFETRIASMANAFDIFEGQWCSSIPMYGGGPSPLFFDSRLKQFDQSIGGFFGKTVIELGPLEAGHTYGMTLLGASEILAIEANQDAYLRCLVVKEAFNLNARFICGDFEKYLRASPPRVDVVLASGVLYHMKEPLGLIEAICRTADQICIWTHYYNHHIIKNNANLIHKFDEPEVVAFKDREITVAKQSYLSDLGRTDFAGGTEEYSFWVTLEGFSSAFDALDFDMTVLERQDGHPHGAAATIVANRRRR